MKKAAAALSMALALAAATSAFARPHQYERSGAAGYSTIDSGYGPPNWNELQPSVGGNSN